jgi:hypothetical protein
MKGRMMLGILMGLSLTCTALGESLAAVARQTVQDFGDAIITIEVVSEQKWAYGGSQHESESKSEVLGTVVDPSGVVVTALSSVDRSQIMERLRARQDDSSFTVTVKAIKYILPDNSEIAATVALRDVDLDLAVLVPVTRPENAMTAVDLAGAVEPGFLDEIFTIARMGRIARRTVVGMTGEVQGIVTRPRAYYIPSSEIASAGTGVPVFDAQGRLVGFVLLHVLPGAMAPGAGNDNPVIPIVLPAAEVREVVKQLPGDDAGSEP